MTESPHHILIIDDDARIRTLTARFLADQGYRVALSPSAEDAREKIAVVQYDLMVVDIMMGGESGLDLVRSLKDDPQSPPCLMLTAMGEPGQRLHGLEIGADDYMTKPFEPKELALRIRNLLARQIGANIGVTDATLHLAEGAVAFGPHQFEPEQQLLTTGGRRQYLTSAEKNLLGYFCLNPNAILSRLDIASHFDEQMTGRSIDVAIARLRRKIEPNPKKPLYLLTIRGLGWSLVADTIGGAV